MRVTRGDKVEIEARIKGKNQGQDQGPRAKAS